MRDMTRPRKEVEFGMEHKCCWVIYYIQYYKVACQELFKKYCKILSNMFFNPVFRNLKQNKECLS